MLNALKWVATATLIIGFGFFSAGYGFGWYLQILGGLIWMVAGIMMKDRPIIAAEDPFGDYFDSTLVYGPVFGNLYYAGFRFKLN